MLSWDIDIWQQAAHPIYEMETGRRINTAKNIEVGNHVWIGKSVGLLAGCRIGSDSVVGYGTVASSSYSNNCIIAGNPAKEIRHGISWKRDVTGFYDL